MSSSISGMGHPLPELGSRRRTVTIPTQATPESRVIGSPSPRPDEVPHAPLDRPADQHVEHRPGYVAETDLAPAKVVRTGPAREHRTLWHRPRLLLTLQILAMVTVALTVAAIVGATALTLLTVVALSLVTRFHSGSAALRPGLPHPERMVTDVALPFAVVGALVAFAGADVQSLRDAALLIAGMAGTDAVCSLLRRRLQRPTRVIVVGGRAAIARAASRWADDRHVTLVGGLLLNDHDDNPPVSTTHGVRTIRGIDEVVEWVDLWVADMVVVAPGPGVTSESVRSLSWLMEKTDAALSVMGVLDSVSPHRIDSTVLAGATLIHARSSRPSMFIRTSKWVFDRVVGTALLLLAAPVLAALCLWIRLESDGPGLFLQTRVGRDGRPFTMFKLRTMRTDAEAVKATLAAEDEGNGVLFKLRRDPRITRSGRFLRKTSLDELPQLINVVLGDMSLVGPRPALPAEVAGYDALAARRLAVRPGMTGLWQVSGRSDLSWERSVELDLQYTDNYRLSGDLLIGLRTVDAVVRARGAY